MRNSSGYHSLHLDEEGELAGKLVLLIELLVIFSIDLLNKVDYTKYFSEDLLRDHELLPISNWAWYLTKLKATDGVTFVPIPYSLT